MHKQGVMFQLLDGILRAVAEIDNRTVSLDDVLDDPEIINPQTRRIASHWLFSIYRYRVDVEKYIKDFAGKGKVKKNLSNLALAGVVHCAFQDHVAKELSVNAIVEYTKDKFGLSESRFINALLRKVCREQQTFSARLPQNIAKKWRKMHGNEFVLQAEKCLGEEPIQTFRLRPGFENSEFAAEKIAEDLLLRFDFFKTSEMDKCLASECFARGGIYIQDSAAGAAVELTGKYVNGGKNGRFIDVCGAPGGKAIMFHDLFPDWEIFIGDRSRGRQQRTEENLKRCNISAEILIFDAAKYKFEDKFDVVFADVPCSNSGVFRKRPDALYRLNDGSLNEIVEMQKNILENSRDAVADNGFLVYSTCSIENEEDGMQVREFCRRHKEFEMLEERLTLPTSEHDGSYCAVLRRLQ